MMRRGAAVAAAGALAAGWAFALADGSFSAHMVAHVVAISLAAPLLVLGISRRPQWLGLPMAALAACALELVVVWGWHAPWLHLAARSCPSVFAVEQLSFLAAGYAVWGSALPASPTAGSARRASLAGAAALLATSMHMSLLGGLLCVSPRAWYHGQTAAALWDQQLGGTIMVAVGGIVYLAGALSVLAWALTVRVQGTEGP